MAIDSLKDKAVVLVNKGGVTLPFGFPHVYSAAAFVERQVIKPQLAFEAVQEAMNGGTEIDGVHYEIQDVDIYLDNQDEVDGE